MKDSCGFEIKEGLYSDSDVFHYYHIKKTPKGFLIRESKEKQYAPLLKESFASGLVRLIRQDELISLINSVEERGLSQTSPKCTEGNDRMLGDHMGTHSHPLPGDD
jgi:hypothetical protein